MTSPRDQFLKAAFWNGPIEPAEAILAAHPEIAGTDIHTAALLGDATAIRRFLAADPAAATVKDPLDECDALTHLCFSKYLRCDPARTPAFLESATLLLDAGAEPNTGFFDYQWDAKGVRESALYGAAGVAHHAALTRLLLERGADPNDDEVPYHSPETYDLGALRELLGSGRLNARSLSMMLVRKHDWHDLNGLRLVLEHGADPNHWTIWHRTPFFQCVLRDNQIDLAIAALDHGANPALGTTHISTMGLAAVRGRGDLLELFEQRGVATPLNGVQQLAAAAARHKEADAHSLATPELREQLRAHSGEILAGFASNGNTEGMRILLDLGADLHVHRTDPDGYWGMAKNNTPLHVAAWRAQHSTVRLLIERGAEVDAPDAQGQTPLTYAVRAAVHSYWMHRRSPDSVRALLDAGASIPAAKLNLPCGYAEIDQLLVNAS